jgi:hypothetical protein
MPTDYQFDNVLWMAFHGAYGMFVDNVDATVMPLNHDEQWIDCPHSCELHSECDVCANSDCEGIRTIPDPDFDPIYEHRTLPGQPDYEAVICHECAHELCKQVPWINKLIDPYNSHAHSRDYDWTGHQGWDLEQE